MERGFYKEDIEELLKEKADQYKMYPSDKVWKGIHRSLHPNRKWYWFSLLLFLSAVGYYTFIEFITPSSANKSIAGNNTSSTVSKPTETTETNTPKAVIVPFGNPNKQTDNTSGNTTKQRPFVLNPNNSDGNTGVVINMAQPVTSTVNSNTPGADNHTQAPVLDNEAPVYNLNAWQFNKINHPEIIDNPLILADNHVTHLEQPAAQVPVAALITPTSVDESKLDANSQNADEDNKRLSWLAHNAVYELAVPKQKRLSWQLSFTPTMNYRTLKGRNYSTDAKTPLPLARNIPGNIEQLVNHKPALGFELGSNILYAVNKTFTLKAGLLFNYIRYDIQAYSSSTSEPAIIALNSNYGIVTGTLTSYTRYRNFNGSTIEDFPNQYFQLSVPLGMEINLLGNDKLQVGIAGTVQPTYLLNRNTYLITADYKYAKEPSLVRRWNINTSAEAFISYKTGNLKWQVGPQIRYQLLSSHIKEYPIREHLFNYGVKIGVAKTIR
ncbi:hypothetical protein FAM09_04885 [Niastella caeni]|uniref:Outer membrane protein beta-barrel domain-containing protein n=1 Tax=Niastella caeni TaxID=2569763 RepID=A0A4V4H1R3_9BACT|nr:hypothetical protein [Niastella caeni]THU41446.1 hypothetical protein FAM09_04885 [Niastella caeni]